MCFRILNFCFSHFISAEENTSLNPPITVENVKTSFDNSLESTTPSINEKSTFNIIKSTIPKEQTTLTPETFKITTTLENFSENRNDKEITTESIIKFNPTTESISETEMKESNVISTTEMEKNNKNPIPSTITSVIQTESSNSVTTQTDIPSNITEETTSHLTLSTTVSSNLNEKTNVINAESTTELTKEPSTSTTEFSHTPDKNMHLNPKHHKKSSSSKISMNSLLLSCSTLILTTSFMILLKF